MCQIRIGQCTAFRTNDPLSEDNQLILKVWMKTMMSFLAPQIETRRADAPAVTPVSGTTRVWDRGCGLARCERMLACSCCVTFSCPAIGNTGRLHLHHMTSNHVLLRMMEDDGRMIIVLGIWTVAHLVVSVRTTLNLTDPGLQPRY